MPKVSVILPVYNGAQTLREAIDSLVAQTFCDWELLIVDDGSTDGSPDVIASAMSRDSRIRLVGSGRVGLVEALRMAALESRGEFLARMDADDISHPDRLGDQLNCFARDPELALVGSQIECFPRHQIAGGMLRYSQWLNSVCTPDEMRRAMFIESPFCHPTVVMRRQAYERVGGYIDDGCPEDYGLWLRFDRYGLKMAKVPRVLLFWRESGGRLTRTDPRYGRDKFFTLKRQNLLLGPLSGCDSVVIWGAGREGRKWQKELRQRGVETLYFIDVDPRKIKGGVRGIPVHEPDFLKRERPPIILAAVGSSGIRDQIRSYLEGLGLEERLNFICVI